jgi:hypothetical protein
MQQPHQRDTPCYLHQATLPSSPFPVESTGPQVELTQASCQGDAAALAGLTIKGEEKPARAHTHTHTQTHTYTETGERERERERERESAGGKWKGQEGGETGKVWAVFPDSRIYACVAKMKQPGMA